MRWLWVAAMLGIMGNVSQAQARLLDIGGSLSFNYNRSTTFSDTATGSSKSSLSSFGQQYSLETNGGFYRLGSYAAGISWLDQLVNLEDTGQKNRFNVTDYHLSLSLFPQWSPLSLNRRRAVRHTEVEAAASRTKSRDQTDSFSAAWVLNIRRLPKLSLNYQRSELKTGQSADLFTRSAVAATDITIGPTRVAAVYQFSDTGTAGSPTSRSDGYNLNTNSQFTPALSMSASARYSTTALPETASGANSFEERSLTTNLIYHPPRHWWNGGASYSYSENPVFSGFKSHALQGAASLRYDEKTDSGFGARYLRFSVADSTINSESGNASLNYRPMFGLTAGVNGAVGLTSTRAAGVEDKDSLFQNYLYTLSYTRSYDFLQYATSYQLTYGAADEQPRGFHSRDLGNSVTLGVDNTNTRILHVGLRAGFSHTERVAQSVETEQSAYQLELVTDSAYLQKLVFLGGRLRLQLQAGYSGTTGVGASGRVVTGGLNAAYQPRVGPAVTVDYRIEDYPTEQLLDRQIITSELQSSTYLIRGLNLATSVRHVWEDNRYRTDVSRLEGGVTLAYQIGQVALGTTYQRTETRSAGNHFGNYSILAHATRVF